MPNKQISKKDLEKKKRKKSETHMEGKYFCDCSTRNIRKWIGKKRFGAEDVENIESDASDIKIIPGDEEMKREVEYLLKQQQKKLTDLYVIYTGDCECTPDFHIEYFVVLDRYPMSKEIYFFCPKCKKGVITKISDPITFYHCGRKTSGFSHGDISRN